MLGYNIGMPKSIMSWVVSLKIPVLFLEAQVMTVFKVKVCTFVNYTALTHE